MRGSSARFPERIFAQSLQTARFQEEIFEERIRKQARVFVLFRTSSGALLSTAGKPLPHFEGQWNRGNFLQAAGVSLLSVFNITAAQIVVDGIRKV